MTHNCFNCIFSSVALIFVHNDFCYKSEEKQFVWKFYQSTNCKANIFFIFFEPVSVTLPISLNIVLYFSGEPVPVDPACCGRGEGGRAPLRLPRVQLPRRAGRHLLQIILKTSDSILVTPCFLLHTVYFSSVRVHLKYCTVSLSSVRVHLRYCTPPLSSVHVP